ncbi:MAG: peptidylprolyl isomerase [Acidimicrobiia bacterium]|nr:MAG: peptidylprolyl isomerase [Acidimicrobiia bacterium]
MKKIVVAAGALTILLAACSGSSEVVASVNGVDVSRAKVESMVRDAGSGFTTTDFATYLSVVIQWEAAEQAAAGRLGLEVAEGQVDDRVVQLVTEFDPSAELDDYLEAVNASESGIRNFARQLILQDAIQAELSGTTDPVTDDDVANEIAEFMLDWTQVCASHILVATEEEAVAGKARLDAGEGFADLAAELSLDTGSAATGGDLGCASPSEYVGPFAEATMSAEIGVVTEPVATEFGYHLILVTDRTEATDEEVRQYLEQSRMATAVDDWFLDVIKAANITVDEAVGEWVTDPNPRVIGAP